MSAFFSSSIEDLCMAHRYLYYVKGTPAISDFEYDNLEKEALKTVPENSPLRNPGSDLESSYSNEQQQLANRLL